jgi:hypothetical protein
MIEKASATEQDFSPQKKRRKALIGAASPKRQN